MLRNNSFGGIGSSVPQNNCSQLHNADWVGYSWTRQSSLRGLWRPSYKGLFLSYCSVDVLITDQALKVSARNPKAMAGRKPQPRLCLAMKLYWNTGGPVPEGAACVWSQLQQQRWTVVTQTAGPTRLKQ